MSFSIQRAVSDGTLALLPISIKYFDRQEISVLFNGVVNALPWSWVGVDDATISFTPPIPNMVEVSILRSTDLSALRHSFSMGAQFTATSLDESLLQILHIAQESKEGSGLGEVYQNLNLHGFKAINMGNGSNPGDAVNHAQMQVHDATIVAYRDEAEAAASAAAASAASINPVQFPTPTAADVIPMTNPAGNGWLYKTVAQVSSLLGLGSSATKNVGIAANNVLQLDGAAKIPAVDGSQLTNLPAVTLTGNQTVNGVKTFGSQPVVPMQSMVRVNTANGYGSTNTMIRRFLNTVVNQGSDITHTDSATLGGRFTINTSGVYAISYTPQPNAVNNTCGISLNTSAPTTAVHNIPIAERLALGQAYSSGAIFNVAWAGYLPAGSVIRAHDDAGNSFAAAMYLFSISRIG